MNCPICTQVPPPLAMPRGIGLQSWLWPKGRGVNIHFLDGTQAQIDYTIGQAEKLRRYANLKFNWHSSLEDSDIRITFAIENAAWSYIGTVCLLVAKTDPTMSLGFFESKEINGEEWDRIVLHEFGHALGMIHEHTHPGADIPWDNETRHPWTYEEPPEGEILIFNEFDRDSMMIYPITNHQTIGNYETALNFRPSAGDIEWLGGRYPLEDGGTVVLPPKDPKEPEESDIDIFIPLTFG